MMKYRRKSADQSLSNRIQSLAPRLISLIDSDAALIHQLVLKQVLTTKRANRVRALPELRARNEHLVGYLSSASGSERKCREFVAALELTDQRHVGYLITPPEDGRGVGDFRPLDDDLLSTMYRSMPLLDDRLIVDDDLIAEMTTSSCCTENQLTIVRGCAGDSPTTQPVRTLFDILARRSVHHFWSFVECVRRTQPHLVPLLTGDIASWFVHPFRCPRPLDDVHLHRLVINREPIVDCLRLDDRLVTRLSTLGCVTDRQRLRIETTPPGGERTTAFLDIVSGKSVEDFNRVVAVLCDSGQPPLVATLLSDNAVALQVESEFVPSSAQSSAVTIASRYSALLRENRRERNDLRERLEFNLGDLEMGVAELGLAPTNDGRIRSYLVCRSLGKIAMLRSCWDSGLVHDVLERICDELSDNGDVLFSRSTLLVGGFDFAACAENMMRLDDLTKRSQPWDISSQFCDLPFEIQQQVIIKSIVHWRDTLRTETQQRHVAEAAALSNVSSVSVDWHRVVTDVRRRYRHKILQLFRILPQLTGRIRDVEINDVSGVAVADDRVLVACRRSANIRVFRATPPHERLVDIFVADRVRPSDITVRRDTLQLYVADEDQGTRGVWRLSCAESAMSDPSRRKVIKLIRADYDPYSLSVDESTRRVLVVPGSSPTDAASTKYLYIYDADDGRPVHCVVLQSHVNPLHAVQLPAVGGGVSPGIIIAHTVWHYGRYHCVSLLDAADRMTTFDGGCDADDADQGIDGPEPRRRPGRRRRRCCDGLYWPLHVAADSDGRILVACVANGRIVRLAPPLSKASRSRVLIGGRRLRPRRLCYEPTTRRLVVGLDGEGVDILQL